MAHYELIVIGAGPGGQKAALQASKLHKSVAIVERESSVGGFCVTTATLPSKTLRESVSYLSGLKRRNLASHLHAPHSRGIIDQLLERKSQVIDHEVDLIEDQLSRNHVDVLRGEGGFADAHTVRVTSTGGTTMDMTADRIVIATGSRPAPPHFPAEGLPVIDSDTVLGIKEIPKTLTVLGAGVVGCEYACIFARLGSKVNIVDRRTSLLPFMDSEIVDTLAQEMRLRDVTVRRNEELDTVRLADDGRAEVCLQSGKVLKTDMVFVAMGRESNIEALGLEQLGIEHTESGLIIVNEHYQTNQPHIYAVGDAIGFPALASASMEQGRLAACHAFDESAQSFPETFPYGIYTIPEMSYVGRSEEEMTREGVPYEIGRAMYSETARGQIMGEETGVLKLLFHRETLELLGVHIIGEQATELIHIGQAVLAHRGHVTYFIDNVFNYPTLAECYKVAALNGVNRL